jgi:hypothetical protein
MVFYSLSIFSQKFILGYFLLRQKKLPRKSFLSFCNCLIYRLVIQTPYFYSFRRLIPSLYIIFPLFIQFPPYNYPNFNMHTNRQFCSKFSSSQLFTSPFLSNIFIILLYIQTSLLFHYSYSNKTQTSPIFSTIFLLFFFLLRKKTEFKKKKNQSILTNSQNDFTCPLHWYCDKCCCFT